MSQIMNTEQPKDNSVNTVETLFRSLENFPLKKLRIADDKLNIEFVTSLKNAKEISEMNKIGEYLVTKEDYDYGYGYRYYYPKPGAMEALKPAAKFAGRDGEDFHRFFESMVVQPPLNDWCGDQLVFNMDFLELDEERPGELAFGRFNDFHLSKDKMLIVNIKIPLGLAEEYSADIIKIASLAKKSLRETYR